MVYFCGLRKAQNCRFSCFWTILGFPKTSDMAKIQGFFAYFADSGKRKIAVSSFLTQTRVGAGVCWSTLGCHTPDGTLRCFFSKKATIQPNPFSEYAKHREKATFFAPAARQGTQTGPNMRTCSPQRCLRRVLTCPKRGFARCDNYRDFLMFSKLFQNGFRPFTNGPPTEYTQCVFWK